MLKGNLIFVLKSFLIWRIGIFLISVFAVNYVPLFSHNYLGGGYSTYILNPLFWGHFNFDGEHYLAIAQNGYLPLQYFFFPLYPFIVKTLSFNNAQTTLAATGLVISNLSFFIALTGIYKLVKLDYKEHIAKLTVLLFVFFPTSFYFSAYYSESIFLMLVVWSIYLLRKDKLIFGAIIASLASAARVIGGVLLPVLIVEMIVQRKRNFLAIIIAPLGVLTYMYYLLKQTGDPLIFLHQVTIFGQQRSSRLILLPQVFYRYIFEILPHVTYSFFPNVFTTYLEFTCGIIILLLVIFAFFKLRISYSIYALLAYLIPTLAGSFSSMPRYVLAIFPVFILSAIYLNKIPKIYTYIIFSVMLLLLIISESLFWRGYWLS